MTTRTRVVNRAAFLTRPEHRWLRLGALVALIALWEALARAGLVPVLFLPSPLGVLGEGADMVRSGELLGHLVASLQRLALGFAVGAVAGVAVGVGVGFFAAAEAVGTPVLAATFPIPKIALLPLLILWLGLGEPSKVAVIALGVFFPMAINTFTGVREADPLLVRAAVAFGARRWSVIRKVVLPSALPMIFAGLRLGAGTALLLLVAAEMIAVESGIGFLVLHAGNLMQTTKLMVGIVVLSLLGVLSHWGLGRLERLVIPWRTVVLVVAVALGAAPALAQPRVGTPRVGLLLTVNNPARIEAFDRELRALGYEPGKTILIERRAGPYDRLDALAAELVRLNVDVIVTDSAPPTAAAQKATRTIPIVFAATADPVGAGFVQTLARPGGNITGFSEITPELTGKRLQLLKEAVPGLSTVGVLGNPAHSFHGSMVKGVEEAARQAGLKVVFHEARTQAEGERAVAAMARERMQALLLLPHPLFSTDRFFVARRAVQHRLPLSATSREMTEAGGLLAYAPDYVDQSRLAATYVDKILKGARPADLPVQRPTKFELFVNLKTAATLGIQLPQSLVLRADHVIQ